MPELTDDMIPDALHLKKVLDYAHAPRGRTEIPPPDGHHLMRDYYENTPYKTKPRPELTFMDTVHDWTFNKNGMGTYGKLSPETLAVQAKLRGKLRMAQRFIVDDEAVQIVAGLSRDFDRLESWSFLARLPYDIMWLQFNLHEKVRSLRALNPVDQQAEFRPEEVSPMIGYLLFRDTDGPSPVWCSHEFYQSADGNPFIGMLAYVFDPEGDPMWPIRGSKTWRSPTLSVRKGFPRMPISIVDNDPQDGKELPLYTMVDPEIALCGVFEPNYSGSTVTFSPDEDGYLTAETDMIQGPDWFVNRAAVIVDPWWDHYFAKRARMEPEQFHKFILHEVAECRGALKFLICMLAAINALPRDVRPVVTRTGTRNVAFHKLPYFGHSTIRLELPRDNRLIYARQTMDRATHEARKHRQHPVIGHWRVVERGRKITHVCRHMPTMVESGLGMCENCEMLIRWIPQHSRGDPSLGIIDRNIEVTTKKSKRSAT